MLVLILAAFLWLKLYLELLSVIAMYKTQSQSFHLCDVPCIEVTFATMTASKVNNVPYYHVCSVMIHNYCQCFYMHS